MYGSSKVRAWTRRAWTWLPLALAAPLVACGPKQPHFIDLMHAPHPWDGAVFCNIEDRAGRHCATAEDKAQGIRIAAAAEAMVAGKQSTIALDDSPEALARCNGEPEAIPFWTFFPRGIGLCAGCSGFQTNDDVNALCHGMCEMELTNSANPAPPDVVEFCAAHSSVAVNATEPTACFGNACNDGDHLHSWVDPRTVPEAVLWQDLIRTVATGGDGATLTRNAASSGNFDAGAASTQTITHGDGYVEFTAIETTAARLGGLSIGAPPDQNPDFTNIDYAIDLFANGCFYVFEKGVKAAGSVQTCTAPDAFGSYAAGDRFRVSVRDNFNGTATIAYAQVTPACRAEIECPPFYTSLIPAQYPLRVDASFREIGGTLFDVRIVRLR